MPYQKPRERMIRKIKKAIAPFGMNFFSSVGSILIVYVSMTKV
jgi:hypothetical protein